MKMKFFRATGGVFARTSLPAQLKSAQFGSSSSFASSTYTLDLFQENTFKLEIDNFNSARLSLDMKLNDHLTKADRYCKNHEYTNEKLELTKITSITTHMDSKNLTIPQKELIAKCHTRLAEIYRVGTLDDENIALKHAHSALELDPSLKKPLQIISSIAADRAEYPEDFKCDGFNNIEDSNANRHN